jgi:hypothetical protein
LRFYPVDNAAEEGGRHDTWRAKKGNKFQVPRHDDDLGYGLLAKIIKQAGVDMSVSEFLNAKKREDIIFLA